MLIWPGSSPDDVSQSNTSRGPTWVAPPPPNLATTPWYDNHAAGHQAQRQTAQVPPTTQYPQSVPTQTRWRSMQQQHHERAPVPITSQQYARQDRNVHTSNTSGHAASQAQAYQGFTRFASVTTPSDLGTKYDAPPSAPPAPQLAQSSFNMQTQPGSHDVSSFSLDGI